MQQAVGHRYCSGLAVVARTGAGQNPSEIAPLFAMSSDMPGQGGNAVVFNLGAAHNLYKYVPGRWEGQDLGDICRTSGFERWVVTEMIG